jgi:hypothetical protein
MRPSFLTLFGALLTLCWSLTASAGPQDSRPSEQAPRFLSLANFTLDLAFENFVARSGKSALHRLAGPSAMDCQASAFLDGIETCVVTASRKSTSIPAALATR